MGTTHQPASYAREAGPRRSQHVRRNPRRSPTTGSLISRSTGPHALGPLAGGGPTWSTLTDVVPMLNPSRGIGELSSGTLTQLWTCTYVESSCARKLWGRRARSQTGASTKGRSGAARHGGRHVWRAIAQLGPGRQFDRTRSPGIRGSADFAHRFRALFCPGCGTNFRPGLLFLAEPDAISRSGRRCPSTHQRLVSCSWAVFPRRRHPTRRLVGDVQHVGHEHR